jgi:glycosyltransferase involved in cell wall biosynthesis
MSKNTKHDHEKLGTLLVLSTYPIRKPRHGGQLRSAALMVEYNKVYSKVVRTAVFNSSVYSKKEYDKHDIPSPAELTSLIVETPELEAWYLGESPANSPEVKKRLTSLLEELKPDAIVFEQAYMYLGMQQLLYELDLKTPLIYSSHNVEADMMNDIFTTQNNQLEFSAQLEQLEAAEKLLTKSAVGTIAVSDDDAQKFQAWGAQNVLIQGNSTSPLTHSLLKRLRVRRIMKKLNITSYALLVASSHRPNVDGFIDILGTRLGYIPENSMIFLAGDLGRALHPAVAADDPQWNNLFWNRVLNWDRVSPATLSALITESTCIILPITSGGGSNLKTAEAINSGKPVIATTTAMRGFEVFGSLEKITVVENQSDFRSELSQVLSNRSVDEKSPESDHLLWSSQLREISSWLMRIEVNQ